MQTEPTILLHPNIPKPLHGLNPRTIMGQAWWDVERQKAYASTDYHCLACGVHKSDTIIHRWLEAHEYYKFDYSKGIIEIEKIIPLCHACHNYIHNGRLMKMLFKGEVSTFTFWAIVKLGTEVLKSNKLPNNPFMLGVLRHVADAFEVPKWAHPLLLIAPNYPSGGEDVPWQNWRLKFNGRLYEPIHKSYETWKAFYK